MSSKQNKTAQTGYDGSTPLKSVLQETVINKILEGTFQTDAYLEVYPTCKSRKVAEVNASRLLSNAKTKTRIAYKRAELAKKTDITAERVIAEMAKIGFSNLQQFIKAGNKIEDISTLPAAQAAAIESVQTDAKGCKIKLHSKLGALNSLAEILKLKDMIIADFNEIGYDVEVVLVHGKDIGMFQYRNRAFFIGTRRDDDESQAMALAA